MLGEKSSLRSTRKALTLRELAGGKGLLFDERSDFLETDDVWLPPPGGAGVEPHELSIALDPDHIRLVMAGQRRFDPDSRTALTNRRSSGRCDICTDNANRALRVQTSANGRLCCRQLLELLR